jgi:adenine-specific DNA-methyltransferase
MPPTLSSQQSEAPSHLAVTDYQACYFAHHLTRLGAVGEIDQISSTLFDAKVDLKQQTSQVWKNSFADAKEILQAEFDRLKNLGLTSNELQANLRAFIRDNAEVLGEVDRYKFVDDDGVYTGSQSVHNPHPGGYEYEVLHDVTLKPMRMPSNGYRFPYQTFKRDYIDAGRLIYGPDENRIVQIKLYLKDYKDSLRSVIDLDGRLGTYALNSLFGTGSDLFDNPKPPQLLRRILSFSGVPDSVVLDCFAGSGATVEAVHDIVRLAGVQMKYILVEMAAYFDSVLLPRTKKVAYSANWKNGKPQGSNDSLHFFKYFRLESYEDVLNNLPSPDGKLFEAMDQATRDSLITYSLDLELGPHLLNMDAFKDPWGYKIYAQLAGEDEVSLRNVDMVETFNYLIGLKVQSYGPLERYNADFVRLPHGDDKDAKGNPLPDDKREGRLRVEGRLRRDAEGPYVYQRVEGELNDGNATRVLVIWRKLTDDAERDAAVLEAWMARHRETTKERSDYREYHLIYLNGPMTLPQPTQELRTVLPTEQTFKDRMFEDTE